MVTRRSARAWLARQVAAVLLAVTVAGLAVGGLARLAGAATRADAAWLAVGACGLGYALWAMADSLRRRRLGVDVIALLALAGAMAVGELLAAAVISVMLASGRALEAWAAGRARRDLHALLARAPRTARRYRGGSPGDGVARTTIAARRPAAGGAGRRWCRWTAPLTAGAGGAGRVRADRRGRCRSSARPGDAVRSGVVNAGAPFDLRATAQRGGQHLRGHRPAGIGGGERPRRRSSGSPTGTPCGSCR